MIMDQPPNSGPENRSPSDADSSATQAKTAPRWFPDSSTPAAAPPVASSTNIANLNSQILAVLGQRYDILEDAGRGAMGQVYKARDRETGEIVALKLIKPEIASDPAMLERFKSELLFARKITHKNVCRVYEFSRVDGTAYISMEFVDGESLRSVLKRFASLTPRKGIDLALQMCAGLKEAHAQGIVHRDLKPENVMIDRQGNVKLMDFGIARSMEAMTLLTGAMVGTPAYMAPEQAAGKSVDHRADIYALGLMLYEMFTGVQPFRADNLVALAMKHVQESPRPPREIEPGISAPLEGAILKCLEKAPDSRFQSVAELENALHFQPLTPASDRDTTVFPATPSNPTIGNTVTTPPLVSNVPPSPRKSRVGWVAAIVVLGIIAVGAGIIWHARANRNSAEMPAPVSKDSPSPAANVAVVPASPNSGSVTADESVKLETTAAPKPPKPATPRPAEAITDSSTPAHPVAPASSPVPPIVSPTASTVSATAETAPVETARATSQDAPAAFGGPAAKGGGGYVWVSRFPREVGAQNAAKKVEDMGLPVSIVPRHNPITDDDFFVVLSGPYSAAKIGGIIEQLKSIGFEAAKPNKEIVGHVNPSHRVVSHPAP
ncbi:MAG: serine/threonine-protein kinase [Candidatus Acidiferrales bacterium]